MVDAKGIIQEQRPFVVRMVVTFNQLYGTGKSEGRVLDDLYEEYLETRTIMAPKDKPVCDFLLYTLVTICMGLGTEPRATKEEIITIVNATQKYAGSNLDKQYLLKNADALSQKGRDAYLCLMHTAEKAFG